MLLVDFSDMLVPYKFEFTTCDSDIHEISNLLLTAQDLATSYSTYRNRVDLTSLYRRTSGVTCLDKVILKGNKHDLHNGKPVKDSPMNEYIYQPERLFFF